MNAITYKDSIPVYQGEQDKNGLWIYQGYGGKCSRYLSVRNGEVKVPGIFWYTTLPITKHNDENMVLFRKYTPEAYPKYDNYDAINVDKTCDIPADYDGANGSTYFIS